MTETGRSQTRSDERLYGLPGAERMFLDLAEVYETEIKPYVDEDDHTPRVIEEWSVLRTRPRSQS